MINKQSIPFKETGYFSKLICDYLDQKPSVTSLYGNFPDLDGFKSQIELRQQFESHLDRSTLVTALKEQYANVKISDKTLAHIEALGHKNTFTVTTGHQLNLFTGPLYFLYKIASTINTCKRLKESFPEYNFVPIYWMATEDHDFEEIQFFNAKGKKFIWHQHEKGAVGRLKTTGLEEVLTEFKNHLSNGSNHANALFKMFEKAYLEQEDLASATRVLANTLFGKYGLVALDADDQALKKAFIPQIKKELEEPSYFKEVTQTIANFNKLYNAQVNPREINLFYLDKGLRERIVKEGELYKVMNTSLVYDKQSLFNEVESHPEKFSPNVITRPVYQEVILPNLAYIGGGGELAYWLELKAGFDTFNVPFPILMLRNSVLLASKKQLVKCDKLGLEVKDLFSNQQELINSKVKSLSEINLDLTEQKVKLNKMFADLKRLSDLTDQSFTGAVLAQERKQIKGMEHLEKRLLKAQKRKMNELVGRISTLQDELFPRQSLQERGVNFSEFYLEKGETLIDMLLQALDPFEQEFTILEI